MNVNDMLEIGRQRLRDQENARQAKENAEAAADAAHWVALEEAIKADLAAHGLVQFFVTLGRKPEDFRHKEENRYGGTSDYYLRLSVDGIGEISRKYSFFAMKDEGRADYWRPWRIRHQQDINWAAVVYTTYGPWDDGVETVGSAPKEDEWQWFTDLADALAAAEIQYAERNRLLVEGEQRNKDRAQRAERRASQPKKPTTAVRLVDVLEYFIREQIPETADA